MTDGIEATGFGVRYVGRSTPALHDLTFSVRPGELLGVAGATGAGKSTLALACATFIPRVVRAKVEGSLHVAGFDAGASAAADGLGKVGIVFSTPANQLSASKPTVREELAFGLENLAVPHDEMDRRIDAVLERLGIAHLADREPFALSGGEQQRVAIASIVAMDPAVLIVDEPTAQLDPLGTEAIADLLREVVRDGRAVLAAEHAPAILAAAGQVLVLARGEGLALDVPGVALGPGTAHAAGIRTPTLVALAAALGLPPAQAFDETAIARALERADPVGTANAVTALRAGDSGVAPSWPPPAAPTPPIHVEGVVHRYGDDVLALAGVDLRIEPGQRVAIVGRNGSGKTTLAKHLNGLLRPASGRVVIGGGDIASEPVHRLAATVGFVFQHPDDQLFERSVLREVSFGPRNLGRSADETGRLTEAALAATGLADDRATNPYDLDLSRRKLVALASVLAVDPPVVVLDEPTTGQDAAGVARIGAIVDALAAGGRTVIAITHDMELAAGHFDRIVLMREGRIAADGSPRDVFASGGEALLEATGLRLPPVARIAARLGWTGVATEADLATRLTGRGG